MEIHLNTYVCYNIWINMKLSFISAWKLFIFMIRVDSRSEKWRRKKIVRKWKSSTDTKHVLAVVVVDVVMSSEAHAFVRLAFARREHVLAFCALRWRLEELIIIIRRRIRFIYTAREDAKHKLYTKCVAVGVQLYLSRFLSLSVPIALDLCPSSMPTKWKI